MSALATESPEAVLEKKGLKQLNGLWCAAIDAEITLHSASVERLERRIKDLQKQVDQLLEQNERQKAQLAALQAAHQVVKDARSAAKSGSPEQKRLDEQIKQQTSAIEQLKKSIVPADKLGGTAPTKAVAMDLVAVRAELALQVVKLRVLIERAPALYESLRGDSEVMAALAQFEPPGQLASGRTYTIEQRNLSRAEKLIFNDEIPLYREGKQLRLTGIANNELPVTFSLFDRNELTVITHSMAESLGISLDGKPAKELRLDGKHNVQATVIELPRLRFGRHVLQNLDVYVLAPEYEHLGARIGRTGFAGLRFQIAPERLIVRIGPASEAKKE
jgi:hypothetical protein